MDKKYLPLRNTRPLKWIFSISLFLIINITALQSISTGYIKSLEKINSVKTVYKIHKLIKPLFGKKYMYLPFGNWGKIME